MDMQGLAEITNYISIEGWISIVIIIIFGVLLVLSIRSGGARFRSLITLKLAMFLTAILIFGLSILIIQGLFSIFEFSLEGLLWMTTIFVAFFMIFQWLFSPAFINTLYGVKFIETPKTRDEAWLKERVEFLARNSGLKRIPKIGIAWGLNVPNAFAYSSPIYGPHIAVTPSLLRNMPRDEVEAVLAHEVGHLKHRDVTMMLAVSFIPVMLYYLGRNLMFLTMFGYGYRDRDREGGTAYLLIIAIILIIVGIIFHFLVKHFNRLREYYADAHSAMTLNDPTPLQRALARLDLMYKDVRRYKEAMGTTTNIVSMLFIFNYFVDFVYDPIDEYIEELKRRKTSLLVELFMTHPPIPKRIRFLDNFKTY